VVFDEESGRQGGTGPESDGVGPPPVAPGIMDESDWTPPVGT
jgi:hypothetical protein